MRAPSDRYFRSNRFLSVALADPFGNDDVDFEASMYMAEMLADAKSMISHWSDYTPVMLPLPFPGPKASDQQG